MNDPSPIRVPHGVVRVAGCRLVQEPEPWPFAVREAARIDAHWQKRQSENPNFFNGRIVLTLAADIVDGVLVGRCAEVAFADFLYWREHGYPDAASDAFGSALIFSADGKLILGRQRGGNLNAGRVYPPGGFIDPRDVAPDGAIDVVANIRREIAEETGLAPDTLHREPGHILSTTGPQIAIGTVFRSPDPAAVLLRRIDEGRARDPERELAEVLAIGSVAEAAELPLPDWTRRMLEVVLG